jgi:hypothetical protein
MKRTEEILKAVPLKLLSFSIIKFSKCFLFLIIAFAFVIVIVRAITLNKNCTNYLKTNKSQNIVQIFTKFDITYN